MTAVLYIIARNDLDSMNSGKLAAQCSHASNAFINHARKHKMPNYSVTTTAVLGDNFIDDTTAWENETTQGFGTVLVLEGSMNKIKPVVEIFKRLNYIAGIVHDPTYPILDGQVVHHIPLDTCSYIFVPNKEEDILAKTLLQDFTLHK
jgi:peptidyl-tRNA hydrolase